MGGVRATYRGGKNAYRDVVVKRERKEILGRTTYSQGTIKIGCSSHRKKSCYLD